MERWARCGPTAGQEMQSVLAAFGISFCVVPHIHPRQDLMIGIQCAWIQTMIKVSFVFLDSWHGFLKLCQF